MYKNLNKQQSGFTLIELIMVIVIMGALSALAISKFNRNTFDVVAASGELVQAIRYAQNKSMSHSGASNYQIAINGTGYTVTQAGTAITHPLTGATSYTKTWSDITLDTTTTIIFDAYGNPLSLSTPLTITLNKGSDSDSVTVENITGFTR
ncbi:MAG: type II secretion system GspH family protein [Gammaproteobacteria bacterium]|nr:type II secretion system GspH family protein [Gammaproteobacteria bacterium]